MIDENIRNGCFGVLALGWNPLEPSSSSSIFFVSVGISLGVIFIICGVVVFYHFTTFKPQQRSVRGGQGGGGVGSSVNKPAKVQANRKCAEYIS